MNKDNFLKVQKAAEEFLKVCSLVEKEFIVSSSSIPSQTQKDVIAQSFWAIWHAVDMYTISVSHENFDAERSALQQVIGPTLWQCPHYARSFFKPHGMSGDYGIVEMMYDLEEQAGDNPYQSGIVNCLEYCFSTIHSVVGIWDRRRWLSECLQVTSLTQNTLTVLDIPCGGARYIFDFLATSKSHTTHQVYLIDQDPSAIAFVRQKATTHWSHTVHPMHGKISQVSRLLKGKTFNIIISAGMFDYLEASLAKRIIKIFSKHLTPRGKILLTNYHKTDPSRLCKDWGADWQLIFRDDTEMRNLFPKDWTISIEYSQNKCLMMCTASPPISQEMTKIQGPFSFN